MDAQLATCLQMYGLLVVFVVVVGSHMDIVTVLCMGIPFLGILWNKDWIFFAGILASLLFGSINQSTRKETLTSFGYAQSIYRIYIQPVLTSIQDVAYDAAQWGYKKLVR